MLLGGFDGILVNDSSNLRDKNFFMSESLENPPIKWVFQCK